MRVVEPAAFTKLSALGVEEQRVNIIIDLVEPPAQRSTLGDGYRVEAQIVVWQKDDVIKVPSAALFRVDDQWSVFTVGADNLAELTIITLGRQNDMEAQVLDGVPSDARVILHPSDKIEHGTLIKIR